VEPTKLRRCASVGGVSKSLSQKLGDLGSVLPPSTSGGVGAMGSDLELRAPSVNPRRTFIVSTWQCCTRNFLTFVKTTGSAYACRSQDMEDGPIVFKVTTHKSRSVT